MTTTISDNKSSTEPLNVKAVNKNLFSLPDKILRDFEEAYEERNEDGLDNCDFNDKQFQSEAGGTTKRKPDSPVGGTNKKTGSGRKKAFHAERDEAVFRYELKEIETYSRNKTSTVKKQKAKKDVDILLEKYNDKMFNNPKGSDPKAQEHWKKMTKEAERVKALLDW